MEKQSQESDPLLLTCGSSDMLQHNIREAV